MTKEAVYAKYNNAKISPKKVAPVMDMVRGKSVEQAKMLLAFDTTKAAVMILKALRSAVANAKNNKNLKPENLYVTDLRVDGASFRKSGQFVSRGRFNPILKRYSHITVGLTERAGK